MRDLLRNGAFHLAFGWSMLVFAVVNLLVHVYKLNLFQNRYNSGHAIAHAGGFESGFPFTMYSFGFKSYLFDENWVWSGLFGNILVAAATSFVAGVTWVRLQIRKKRLQ